MLPEQNRIFYPLEEIEPVQDLMDRILQANDLQINEFISAIMRRYRCLHPDWEIMTLAMPTDPALRKEAVENIVNLLLTHGTIPGK